MKHIKEITLKVNGKVLKGRVTVHVEGLDTEDCVSPQMVLTAVANNQNLKFISRHHKNRVAEIQVETPVVTEPRALLRLVA